jgi:glycerol uptake facilitator-like aquaporin
MVSVSLFAVGVVAALARNMDVFTYALIGTGLFQLLAGELMFQGFIVALALLVGPFFFAVYGVHQNNDNWRTWQFWVATVLCEITGGYIMIRMTRKYCKYN